MRIGATWLPTGVRAAPGASSATAAAAVVACLVAACAPAPPHGAPSPPKGITLVAPDAAASATASPAPGVDTSPSAAAGIVQRYFATINAASVAGQVADISGVALSGCQPCTADVTTTRGFAGTREHADVGSLAVTGLAVDPRIGNSITVRITLVVRAQRLLDAKGRVQESFPAQPPRTATVVLALTTDGWRIQTFVYAARPT